MAYLVQRPATPALLRGELRRRGITQADLARRIGKSPAMVSLVLRGLAVSRPVLEATRRILRRER